MGLGAAVGMVVIACIIGAFGAIYLKRGAKSFSLNILKLLKNYAVILGVFLYGISTIIYIMALRMENLSVLYPLVSLTYVFVSILSVRMLGEKMNKWRWFGVAAIIIGVSLIGLSG